MKVHYKEKEQLRSKAEKLSHQTVELEDAESRRKRAEEELRESEQRYSSLFKNNHSVMLLIDPESGDIVDANPAACAYYGWSQQEITDMKITDINMLSNEQVFQEMECAKFEKRHHFFFRHRLANEEIREVEVYSGPIRLRGKKLLYSIIHDITDRKRIETTLKESEAKLNAMLESIGDPMSMMDKELNIIWANKTAVRFFGDDIIGKKCYQAYHQRQEPCEPYPCLTLKVFEDGKIHRHDTEVIDKDGKTRHFNCTSSVATTDEAGTPTAVIEISRDTTESVRTRDALRQSKELFEKIFLTQQDALFIMDSSNPPKILDCNPAATEVFGYSREEILGRTSNILHVDEATLRKFQKHLYQSIAEHNSMHLSEFAMKRKNGTVFPTEHTVMPLEDNRGERIGWVSVVRDISATEQAKKETKTLEVKLLQAKKMEAIANLSGGVARELDNLFQTVQGYVEQLLWDRKKDDPIYQELLDITHAALRGARLTRKLLTFSGHADSKKRPVDLNQEVMQARKLLSRTMPANIEFELHLADDLKIINADPAQIEQILLALALNARDAMPEGGKITIGTEGVSLDKQFCRTHPEAEAGESVMLTVSDTGHGIGQETIVHVFDPFYTKKNLDDGSGLGLSRVYGIVKNHGGFVLCFSESGVGTTFKIYFPATKKEAKLAARIEMEV